MAGDAALTRFANSQIHQNVAERRDGQPPIRRRQARQRRVQRPDDDEGLRRLAETRGHRRGASKSWRTGLACPSLPRVKPVDGAGLRRDRGRHTGVRAEGVPGRHRGRRRRRRPAYGRSRPAPRPSPSRTRRASGRRDADRRPAPDRVDGSRRRHRLRGAGGGRRDDHRPGGRARGGCQGPGDRECRGIEPATTPWSSRSTRSSTSSTCSATSASRRWPSRRSGRSTRSASASAANS